MRAPILLLLGLFAALPAAFAGDASSAAISSANLSMTQLSDDEMSGVRGRQGVVLDLKLRNNVDAAYAPIGCTVATGTPFGTPNPCRIGIEFAARAGIWLMLKEYYGYMQLKDIRLDVAFLPGTNTGFQNAARFQNAAGTSCLLAGHALASCWPTGDAAIKLSYPGTDGPAVYDDFYSFLNVGRAWLEYDCNPGGSGATLCTPATAGYNRDTTTDSAFSMRMADSTALNAPARMRFLGNAYVFGF
ncbi:MAG: hypothetical protein ACOY33_08010 [Pseudomonadota bacterium]